MKNWKTVHLPDGKYAIENSGGRRLLAGLALETLNTLVDEHNTDLNQAVRDMLPVSNDGDFVFIDGPGDVELDHQGTMRKALETIAAGADPQALIAQGALRAIEARAERKQPRAADTLEMESGS